MDKERTEALQNKSTSGGRVSKRGRSGQASFIQAHHGSGAFLGWFGRLLISTGQRLADQAGFAGRILLLTWTGRSGRRRLLARLVLAEIYRLAQGCFSLIVLVGFMLGFLWSFLWFGTLSNIGGVESISTFLVSIHAIQIAPIMTTVIVILRYGAPITWELAVMKSGHQFETLLQMGIPPEHYLAAPRIIGTFLATPILLTLFLAASFAGSYYMAWRQDGQAILEFVFTLSHQTKAGHFAVMAFKSVAISLTVSFFCVYNGFSIRLGAMNQGAVIMRRAMGEAFFYSILTSVLVSVFYSG
ncbi:hypothetical protein C4J81_01690 [Deltaproteobacteria bacterium Smac51]|nr:hypothetical protein C4J81_01690 [Deltaproteobacteria bacterium Smac51]